MHNTLRYIANYDIETQKNSMAVQGARNKGTVCANWRMAQMTMITSLKVSPGNKHNSGSKYR